MLDRLRSHAALAKEPIGPWAAWVTTTHGLPNPEGSCLAAPLPPGAASLNNRYLHAPPRALSSVTRYHKVSQLTKNSREAGGGGGEGASAAKGSTGGPKHRGYGTSTHPRETIWALVRQHQQGINKASTNIIGPSLLVQRRTGQETRGTRDGQRTSPAPLPILWASKLPPLTRRKARAVMLSSVCYCRDANPQGGHVLVWHCYSPAKGRR